MYDVCYSVLSIPHLDVQEKHFLCNKINTTNEFKIEYVLFFECREKYFVRQK